MDEYGSSDCAPCRLISGLGFLGIGLYVGLVGTKNTKGPISRFAIRAIGIGFAGIGVARLLGLPPFPRKKLLKSVDKT